MLRRAGAPGERERPLPGCSARDRRRRDEGARRTAERAEAAADTMTRARTQPRHGTARHPSCVCSSRAQPFPRKPPRRQGRQVLLGARVASCRLHPLRLELTLRRVDSIHLRIDSSSLVACVAWLCRSQPKPLALLAPGGSSLLSTPRRSFRPGVAVERDPAEYCRARSPAVRARPRLRIRIQLQEREEP